VTVTLAGPGPTPYLDAAPEYHAAGWTGVLPLPAAKKHAPPTGFTGDSGAWPTVADIKAWIAQQPTGNIALRLDENVIGIDVDAYDGKPGWETLQELEAKLGPLPPTVMSTSRTDGKSGIRFFRLPTPMKLIGSLPGIEIIQRHHRYAVVWPSIHPEGRTYIWMHTGTDAVMQRPPRTAALPILPAAWVDHLDAAKHTSTERRHLASGREEPSPAVLRALGEATMGLHAGTRHDAALAGVTTLTRLASLGHPGADSALGDLEAAFLAAIGDSRSDSEARGEWQRMIDSADELVTTTPASAPQWEGRTERASTLRTAQMLATPSSPDTGEGAVPHWNTTLVIEDLATIAARVAAAKHPGWLARSVWPADAYGIIGAENKAGKTWAILDLAVAGAAGASWLGAYPVDHAGPVLAFLGEGGERKMIRRIRAVAAHHGVDFDALPVRLCHRAPHLTSVQAMDEITAELAAHPAVLVIIDPLYLAAKGSNGASLYEMGAALEGVQVACQQAGAALAVVHHWNQTGAGKGRERFSGAGPAEWGRVTCSLAVENRRTEGTTTIVTLRAEFVGDEIPDTEATFERRVWADDPDDLDSAMHYEIVATTSTRVDGVTWDGPTQCMAALRQFFAERAGVELSKSAVVKQCKDLGVGYRPNTVGQALEQLATEQYLAVRNGSRGSRMFSLAPSTGDPDGLDF
jgi:hypothetical protein